MNKIVVTCCALFCFLSSAWAADSTVPKVVVSIKPLHSLVAGVMQGVGEPLLVVEGGGSPHGYVLRPSEAQALSKADLVVWVGHELESFLEKPLATLGRQARQLELAKSLQKDLLSKRKDGSWEKPGHHRDLEHGHDESETPDLHLWLDPRLAQQVVMQTGDILVELDPAHHSEYQANVKNLVARLGQLDQRLKKQLEPVKDTPYIVFHAAYQYFESAYGLNAVGSITIDPDRTPGGKRIKEIRDKIEQMQARCVFSEPQFESRLVATVIEGTGAKVGSLDPLGADIPAGVDAYFQLMKRMGDSLHQGLK